MRIVIDLQACQSESRFRGIGRYSNSLTKAIIRQAGNHEIWIALSDRFPETIPSIRADFKGLLPRERIVTFSITGPVSEENPQNTWRTHAAQLLREYFLAGLNPDIVHVSSMFEGYEQDVVSSIGALDNKITTTATLYDLIPFVNQETYLSNPQKKYSYLRKIRSLKNASCLLAISAFSKLEAIRTLGILDKSIVNISAGVDTRFKPRQIFPEEKRELFDHYKITRPFVLCVPGGFDERKNITGLLTAFSNLPEDIRNHHQLVIAGRIHEEPSVNITRHAKALGLRDDELIMTDYIGDDDLIALYNLCRIFVFPSLYEGFGLPVLEAISCGAIAITSNVTSLPEIIGRKDALFDPTIPDEITNSIHKALTDENFRKNLRDYESKQAELFSWDNSAKKAIVAFEELHKANMTAKNRKYFENEVDYKKLINSIAMINSTETPTNFDLVKTARSITINCPISDIRQILVDISVLVQGDAKSGIQRVVRSILLELLISPPQGYTVKPIYFDNMRYRYANRFVNRFIGNKEAGLEDDVVDVNHGDIYLGLDLMSHLTLKIHSYLKRLNILGIKIVFIVYDIIFTQHPEWWPESTSKILLQWLESITEVSTGLVCISHSTAVEVEEWLDSNPPNRAEPLPIEFFHLGADIENSVPTKGVPDDASFVFKALESAPTFLMVGTIEPRKGHAQAISAFESLWNDGLEVNLVIVGKKGWLVEDLVNRIRSHSMLGKRLFWLDGISDEYLNEIYTASTSLLFASEAEGFGLPLIEAAQKKLPIIARDIPVFREVAGEYAYYFSGMSPDNLAQALKTWLGLHKNGKNPSSVGMPWLTWKESASQLLKAIITNTASKKG